MSLAYEASEEAVSLSRDRSRVPVSIRARQAYETYLGSRPPRDGLGGQSRSGDLRLPKPARSQLRYTQMVRAAGVEPA